MGWLGFRCVAVFDVRRVGRVARVTRQEVAALLDDHETGKNPGIADALRKLSRVLAVPMESLVSGPRK